MTIQDRTESAAAHSEHRPGRDRRGTFPALVVVVAVLVASLSWWMWTSHVTGGVKVAWSAEPECTGTSLRPDGHTIEARQGMSCVITVTVRNDGPVGVHLDSATLPFLGPDGGSVLATAAIDGRRPEGDSGSAIDAEIPLDQEVASGESFTFRVLIVFRDDGCTSAGTMWFDNWPTVQTEHLGRETTVHGAQELKFHRYKQNPGCPDWR